MKNKSFYSLKYLLLIYLLMTVVYPVGSLFATIRGEDVQTVFSSAQFFPMLNSLSGMFVDLCNLGIDKRFYFILTDAFHVSDSIDFIIHVSDSDNNNQNNEQEENKPDDMTEKAELFLDIDFRRELITHDKSPFAIFFCFS